MRIRYLGALVIAATIALVAVPARADFANGSFETGDYSGWTLFEGGSNTAPEAGTWGIATSGQTIDFGDTVHDFFDGVDVTQTSPGLPHTYTATDGTHVALQLQNNIQTHRMYQDVALPPGVATVSWDMEYQNEYGEFVVGFQVLAVTVRNPADDTILATLFVTTQGVDPQSIPMTQFSGDVSAYGGQTVRISVDLIADNYFFSAAFDHFRVDPIDTTSVDFCSPLDYDNAVPPASQTFGRFTDLRRGAGINAVPADCVLNLAGAVGSAGDMWITLLHTPGDVTPEPTFHCVAVSAEVLIKKFDNRKAVGFVTHYDPALHTGLFLGLYDNGNSDALTLSTFDGSTGKLTGTVANRFLGSKIQEDVGYDLNLQICNSDGILQGQASVVVNGVSLALDLTNATAPGIASAGQIGIAGYAKSSFVDSSVRNFEWATPE